MKRIILILLVVFACSGCSKAEVAEEKYYFDMDSDFITDTIYIKNNKLCVLYGKTGYVKSIPFSGDKPQLYFKNVNNDDYADIIALFKNNAYVYDFKKVPMRISNGISCDFSLKKMDNGSLLIIAPNGQSFVAEGNFNGSFKISEPFNFKTEDTDSDTKFEILFEYVISDNDKEIVKLYCTQKYFKGFWHINEIKYEII